MEEDSVNKNAVEYIELIICPWCKCAFEIKEGEEINRCSICAREISAEDFTAEND